MPTRFLYGAAAALIAAWSALAAVAAHPAQAQAAHASSASATPNPYESTYKPFPSQPTLIRNATILTAAGAAIERGMVLLQGGKVAAVVLPTGSGHVLLGKGAMFDLTGAQVPASVVKAPVAMFANLGEAGAAAEGGSRASAMLRLREALQDAIDFERNGPAWATAQRRAYARGRLDLEALRPVIRGEVPLAVTANRASDLLAAMRLADEFHLRLILLGAAEGWRVADELAAKKIPVVIKPLTDIPTFDALGATLENAARLSRAGAILVLSSFDTHNARNLRQEAGNAIAYGLDRDAALRAVTLEAARTWGVAARLGSLEPGKDADVVVWSGDPFELTTRAEQVFINGREMPMDTRQKQLFEKYRTIR